jgi:LysM repeat protein
VFLKAFVIIALAVAVFGTAGYYAYELFVRPQKALQAERALGPQAPPPDPSLPEYDKCMEVVHKGDVLASRAVLAAFVEHNPKSSKIDEARDQLGELNSKIFFSPRPAPEKQVYLVRKGDVLNKVARVTRTTPELLMRANGLTGIMLRIDQKLYYTPAEFSLAVSRKRKMVTLLNYGKFFKQYPVRDMPTAHAAPAKKGGATPPPMKLAGKVMEKIAWGANGGRLIFSDKDYASANHWITIGVPGHTIYSDPDPQSGARLNKPPAGGIGIAPEAAAELSILLTKGNPVTIE